MVNQSNIFKTKTNIYSHKIIVIEIFQGIFSIDHGMMNLNLTEFPALYRVPLPILILSFTIMKLANYLFNTLKSPIYGRNNHFQMWFQIYIYFKLLSTMENKNKIRMRKRVEEEVGAI